MARKEELDRGYKKIQVRADSMCHTSPVFNVFMHRARVVLLVSQS